MSVASSHVGAVGPASRPVQNSCRISTPRLAALVLAFGLLAVAQTALAQTSLSIEQLDSFVRSSIQLKHPDKQVAEFLGRVVLTELLDDRTIEELLGDGAGPKTVQALKRLRDASKSLPKPAPAPPQAPPSGPPGGPPPSAGRQQELLDDLRSYARDYSKNLPDFICTQVTRRYYDPSGLEFWQLDDVITTRLSYFEQREDYKLVMINNQMTSRSYHELDGASSTGEFGTLLQQLFAPETGARFRWERWATLRGRRAHVFSFRVPQPNSRWHIRFERQAEVVAGYKGLVYVDRDTDRVLRLAFDATDIPPSFPVQQAATVLDYDFVDIAGRRHLLPLRAVVRMRRDKLLTKNEVEFRLYRKFAADSVVSFETPEPLPEEQTKEQPLK
ncbi:MAG: hypothetical protein FJW37_05055 [Acidobacteria bacterium]|nr:hypothetical protein [Acidobacteriota bacterium]